jgi:ribonuclease HII
MPILPTFKVEEQYWAQGIALVAGVDEAGLGALAGPVVAGAVVFASTSLAPPPLIRDSKTLSPAQREKAAVWIKQNALAWAVGEASVAEIDTLNVRAASHVAMQRAIDGLLPVPHYLLIDGSPVAAHPHIPAECIVRGDSVSFSIAAASIMAKTHRDQLLRKLDTEHPQYGFAGHKGYGSALHLAALEQWGPCPHHRTSYAPIARLTVNTKANKLVKLKKL